MADPGWEILVLVEEKSLTLAKYIHNQNFRLAVLLE